MSSSTTTPTRRTRSLLRSGRTKGLLSHSHSLALLAVITALRVFLPDLYTGTRRLLRAGARIGVTELLHTQQALPAAGEPFTTAAARDTEA